MTVFSLLVPVSLAAVTVVLIMGVVNMMRGGSPNRSQHLMRMRVLFQLGAIILLMGTLYFTQK